MVKQKSLFLYLDDQKIFLDLLGFQCYYIAKMTFQTHSITQCTLDQPVDQFWEHFLYSANVFPSQRELNALLMIFLLYIISHSDEMDLKFKKDNQILIQNKIKTTCTVLRPAKGTQLHKSVIISRKEIYLKLVETALFIFEGCCNKKGQ